MANFDIGANANQVMDDPITRFLEDHCTGTIYDSCVNSPCRYSSGSGCAHPLHPKNGEHAMRARPLTIEKKTGCSG